MGSAEPAAAGGAPAKGQQGGSPRPGSPTADGAGPRRLLVVKHSRSGTTDRLVDAFIEGTVMAGAQAVGADVVGHVVPVTTQVVGCFDASVEDVMGAAAVALATPANFGYMSGAMKDFFERIYHACLEQTVGRPYVLMVKGDTDVDGAVTSVERIVAGLRWKQVLPPLTVVGTIDPAHLDAAQEMGATLAAGLAEGIF